ncbi:MAG: radical SAM protein, partial [Rhodospirillales bacterium]|nr:radical SAM protein [Rhodospirillales bacterium]
MADEHGCVYCYARPTHAQLGLSPGLEFETQLVAKANAPALLDQELRRPGYRAKTVMLGTATDAYQPLEKKRRITRQLLGVFAFFFSSGCDHNQIGLVVRDIDILAPLARKGLTAVGVSITTLDPRLARIMEPRASAPARRLEAIRAISSAGIPVTVLAAPMIPHLNDQDLERILEAAAQSGADAASYTLLRLPLELKQLFSDWLTVHFPQRASKVLNRLRDCRAGNLYVSEWGSRMTGTGAYAELMAKRFALACRRYGLQRVAPAGRDLDTS